MLGTRRDSATPWLYLGTTLITQNGMSVLLGLHPAKLMVLVLVEGWFIKGIYFKSITVVVEKYKDSSNNVLVRHNCKSNQTKGMKDFEIQDQF